jgi:hypothetical protein
MRHPSDQQIRNGTFKLIDGMWHKRCTGPAHEAPEYLPATEKYFHIRKTTRQGELLSRCRLCTNWARLKSPGSERGWVELSKVLHIFAEATNRIGVLEFCSRTGISPGTMTAILHRRSRWVQKATVRKAMLELISIRRRGEYSISEYARWRVVKRSAGKETCSGCGGSLLNQTDGCSTCWERDYKRTRRAA